MDTIRFFKDHSKATLKSLTPGSAGLQQVQHRVAVDAGYVSWSALLAADEPDRRLAALMVQFPLLNMFGLGSGSSPATMQERRDRFARWRRELRANAAHVDEVRVWLLATIEPRKTLNPNAGSYQLKHIAEETLDGYVSNGELIAAALIGGYAHSGSRYAPNMMFGMREPSIKAAREASDRARAGRYWS